MRAIRLALGASAVAYCLSGAGALHAQTTNEDAPGPVEEAAAPSEDGEIVVTAQRREQRLLDVPISISVVDSGSVDRLGIQSTEALSIAVPGLQFSRQLANGGTPFIRGVGSTQAAQGAEAPVALYVDDVYIGFPSATTMPFNNIQQIEVLRGPQGTLFGRNATGGVVHVRTRQPTHDPEVSATLGFGSYETLDASLYASTGISDNLAVNLAATAHHQGDGYGLNVSTGEEAYKEEYYSARAGVLWTPGSGTSLRLLFDYGYYDGDRGLSGTILPGTISSGGGTFPGRYRTTFFPADYNRTEQGGVSLRFDQDLDFARFVSISAYRENRIEYLFGNAVPSPLTLVTDVEGSNRSFSQEFQLLSQPGGPLSWIFGLFYYQNRARYDPIELSGTSQNSVGGRSQLFSQQFARSYAAFGEASYELTDATKFTVGLRYTRDTFDLDATRLNASGAVLPGLPVSAENSSSRLTYRAVLDHHFTDDLMVYGSVSRGFKSGGFNLSAPTVTVGGLVQPSAAVRPEILDAYEIGLKAQLADNRLRLALSAFHYDYQDLQVTVIGAGTSTTINAASARMRGIDFEATYTPSRRLTISGGASFLDAEFTSFPNGPLTVPNPATCTPVPTTTGPRTGGNITCPADLTGNRTPRSPKFTASLQVTYTIPTQVGDFTLAGSIYHNSGYFWEADNRLVQPDHNIVNGSATWMSSNGRYGLRVWVKNLLDEYYFAYAGANTTREYVSPEPPRTLGVTLLYNWGAAQ